MASGKKGRPKCLRNVEEVPDVNYFKPRGIPLTNLESTELKVEELEAIKLVHYDGMGREDAASRMGVSRRTLQRELKSGLKKIADGLINGKAIEIKGGYYLAEDETVFRCLDDDHEWKALKNSEGARECPECGSSKVRKKKRK